MSEKTPEFDVAIIGLGPTGATLANLLGDFGLSVLVLEREAGIYDLPRAVHFDDEVMRCFQWIGIADELSKNVVVNRGMRFLDGEGNLLLDWPRPQEISDNGWHPSYRLHQPDLERILRAALKQRKTVTVHLAHEVTGLAETGDRVSVQFRQVGKDTEETAHARYVVGCDGAGSTVRAAMQTQNIKLGFEQRWLVVDVHLTREMPELGDHTLQFCDAVRPATYCSNVGRRRRWEFALLDDEDSAGAVQNDFVWRLLSRWITPQVAQIERSAVYTFKSEIAEDWIRGRLCLAGDAAHLTPPFLGQGMCAGIRDVANLAWKLALACRGPNGAALLATYQSERKSNVTEYIKAAVALGELINKMRSQGYSALGEQTDGGAIQMKSVRAGLGPGLGDLQDPLRGKLIRQIVLSNGQRLDDAANKRHVLLTRQGHSEVFAAAELLTLGAGSEPAVAELLDQNDVDAIFVRPDMHILCGASGDKAPFVVLDAARRALILSTNDALVPQNSDHQPLNVEI